MLALTPQNSQIIHIEELSARPRWLDDGYSRLQAASAVVGGKWGSDNRQRLQQQCWSSR